MGDEIYRNVTFPTYSQQQAALNGISMNDPDDIPTMIDSANKLMNTIGGYIPSVKISIPTNAQLLAKDATDLAAYRATQPIIGVRAPLSNEFGIQYGPNYAAQQAAYNYDKYIYNLRKAGIQPITGTRAGIAAPMTSSQLLALQKQVQNQGLAASMASISKRAYDTMPSIAPFIGNLADAGITSYLATNPAIGWPTAALLGASQVVGRHLWNKSYGKTAPIYSASGALNKYRYWERRRRNQHRRQYGHPFYNIRTHLPPLERA